ncbi:uncharacterized protein F5891DRAFT_998596 [Suillus fuscotomentosus]|uniref:DUF6533 domain-containing protein n=1 Tax=Suillus fuscotomentosus TaxID=1912939 RepID=A0AAD4HS41_9AGAM|nr:uncharacterized protein F5891DRAFT_998596 [Suillus fuscotomentosus]KAG1908055.1 hypothetical protein F5891DRAFT_998596 [Suillus fuscotomentosus]
MPLYSVNVYITQRVSTGSLDIAGPSSLSKILLGVHLLIALSATGHTVLIYDYLLTFHDEIRYIWNAPWTIVKVMFLINRYANLVGQTAIRLEEAGFLAHDSELFCHRFAISIHLLVLIRAWAIWGTRKSIIKIMVGSYVFYVLALLGITTLGSIHDTHEEYQYLDLVEICASAMPSVFILDAVTFVLTARSLWRYSREFQSLYPSSLLRLLVRDATMFFIFSMFNNAMIFASWTVYANVSLSYSRHISSS